MDRRPRPAAHSQRLKPDEMLYVGRLTAGGTIPGMQSVRRAPRQELGSGVLIGLTQVGETVVDFPAEIKQLAELNHIPIAADFSAPLIPQSYLPFRALPGRWAHIGIATAWPSTPAELIDEHDLTSLETDRSLLGANGQFRSRQRQLEMAAFAQPTGPQKIEPFSRNSSKPMASATTNAPSFRK